MLIPLKSRVFRITLPVVAAVLITVLVLGNAVPALAAEATNSPGAGDNMTGAGTIAWTDTGNIGSKNDGLYAQSTLTPSSTSAYLRASNFGFELPSNAFINGIEVTINRKASGNLIKDFEVKLVDGMGTVSAGGDNKAKTGAWGTEEAEKTYGGAADAWNAGLTVEDINDPDFGVVISVINNNTTKDRTAFVDYIGITVTYSQSWKLYSDDHGSVSEVKLMGPDGSHTDPVTIDPGFTYWLANVPAGGSVTFDQGAWKLHLETAKPTEVEAVLGTWTPGTGFDAFSGKKVLDGEGYAIFHPGVVTVDSGDYLALKVIGNGKVILTQGDSYLIAPDSKPNYPLPETPAVVLLGVGLMGMAAFVVYRRKKAELKI